MLFKDLGILSCRYKGYLYFETAIMAAPASGAAPSSSNGIYTDLSTALNIPSHLIYVNMLRVAKIAWRTNPTLLGLLVGRPLMHRPQVCDIVEGTSRWLDSHTAALEVQKERVRIIWKKKEL